MVIHHGETFAVELRRHVGFRHRHAHRHCKPLAQRARGGLHSGCVAVFRVAGRKAAGLTEALEVVHCKAIAVKVQKGVFQHGSMPGGEHEAVAA